MEARSFLFTSLRYDPLLLSIATNTTLSTDASNPEPSPFYMLLYHRDRILEAAQHFNYTAVINLLSGPKGMDILLQKLSGEIDLKSTPPLRVKVIATPAGEISVETNPAPAVSKEALYPARLPPPPSAAPLKASPLTGGVLTLGPEDSIAGDPKTTEPWEILPDPECTEVSGYTSYKTMNRDMYNTARERVGIKDMAEKREVLLIAEGDDGGLGKGEIMEGSLTTVYFWRGGKWVTPRVGSGGQRGTTRRWALENGICVERVLKVEDLVNGEMCWLSNGVRGFQVSKVKIS